MSAAPIDPALPRAASAALPPPIPVARQLGDVAAAALAVAVVVGAWWHPTPLVGLGLVPGAALGALGLVRRRPWLLVLGAGLLAAALAGRSLAGLASPPRSSIDDIATLVADPVATPFGTSAEARIGRRHWLIEARDGAAGTLERALAGERLHIAGRSRPPPPGSAWMVPRHLVGVVAANDVEPIDHGTVIWRAANRVRRTIEASLGGWPDADRSLVVGFVLGDDRGQAPEVVSDFRGSGLSHLLVVSGENVAYALAAFGPLLRRASTGWRWVATLAVLGAFGVVTRFEPSVLRAIAMVAVAVTGRAQGRPSPPWRVLALAVAALVLVDPLLVWSVGFRLSVAASVGIVVLSARLASALPGPRPLAEAVAISIAAQLGVAPVLVPFAGGIPVVSLPANVVAGWAAGIVTTWGLPAGVVGGLLGGGLGRWLQAPAIVASRWVALVAKASAALPLGDLRAPHLIALAAIVVAATSPSVRRPTIADGGPAGSSARRSAAGVAVRVAGGLAVAAICFAPAWGLRHPAQTVRTSAGAVVWRAGGATVVDAFDVAPHTDVLDGLRSAGVRRVDVLVARASAEDDVRSAIAHRWHVGRVVDERSPSQAVQVGGLVVASSGRARPIVSASPTTSNFVPDHAASGPIRYEVRRGRAVERHGRVGGRGW